MQIVSSYGLHLITTVMMKGSCGFGGISDGGQRLTELQKKCALRKCMVKLAFLTLTKIRLH